MMHQTQCFTTTSQQTPNQKARDENERKGDQEFGTCSDFGKLGNAQFCGVCKMFCRELCKSVKVASKCHCSTETLFGTLLMLWHTQPSIVLMCTGVGDSSPSPRDVSHDNKGCCCRHSHLWKGANENVVVRGTKCNHQ